MIRVRGAVTSFGYPRTVRQALVEVMAWNTFSAPSSARKTVIVWTEPAEAGAGT
jgi:hypothetical protein